MKNYYTVISRDEFIKLYRFGNIKVSANFILNDDKNIANNIIELFKISSFEYEEGYLILKIIEANMATDLNLLTIKMIYNLEVTNVQSIYVLSEKAKEFYKTKVNSKINFQICPFNNILKEVSAFKEYQDINQGIHILAKQFNFINIEEIERELGSDFKSDFLKSDDYLSLDFKTFYLDLLLYKRENKFTKDDIGYIYDLILIELLKQREPKSMKKFKNGQFKLDNSKTYIKLNANKKEILFENIEFIRETDDENIKTFINKITFNHLVSGAIFLKIKNLLLERDENTQEQILNIVNDFGSKYKDNLSMALYLIGLVFGYKYLYEDYYDFIELDIFKNTESDTLQIEKQEEDTSLKLNDKIKILEEEIKTLESENQKLNEDLEKNKKIVIESNDDLELEKSIIDNNVNILTIDVFSKAEFDKFFKKEYLRKILKAKNIEYEKGDKVEMLIEKFFAKSDERINESKSLFP